MRLAVLPNWLVLFLLAGVSVPAKAGLQSALSQPLRIGLPQYNPSTGTIAFVDLWTLPLEVHVEVPHNAFTANTFAFAIDHEWGTYRASAVLKEGERDEVVLTISEPAGWSFPPRFTFESLLKPGTPGNSVSVKVSYGQVPSNDSWPVNAWKAAPAYPVELIVIAEPTAWGLGLIAIAAQAVTRRRRAAKHSTT